MPSSCWYTGIQPPTLFLGDLMVKLNPNRIERKTFIQEKKNPKHTNVWEWDECKELREFIDKQLHEVNSRNNRPDPRSNATH